MSGRLILRGALLADGGHADVLIDDGVVVEVGVVAPDDATPSVDLGGHVLFGAFAEPHAHLDKAFLADVIRNPTGDLMGAIVAMEEHRHLITRDDTIERAERAARLLLSNGATTIRTHVDMTEANGLMSVDALTAVRERLRDLVDIQVCVLTGWPSIGPEGADQRARLRDAIGMGVDLIGGCPHLEADPAAANDGFLTIAAEAGLPVDLHTDETLDPAATGLDDLARRVLATGFPHAVTASHCVSLGMQPEATQRATAERVAEAGISVVALPHTNLFLQGRNHQQAMPRALTAIRALTEAGVNVCAGADNLQDPFNPVGRADPLETAALMVMAGHLLPHHAVDAVGVRARRALGVAAAGPVVGRRADLVAVPAASAREALAMQPPARTVLRAGRIVAGQALGTTG